MPESTIVSPATSSSIATAAALIRDGGLVAFPTETVYGLGADATNAQAVARVFAAKGRPKFNPLITHLASADTARSFGRFTDRTEAVTDAFWPGPLTIVVEQTQDSPIVDLATAGLPTIALRVPSNAPARDFLTACGVPVVAPSANTSGEVSPSEAQHVLSSLPDASEGGPGMILDGGRCDIGLESTVLDLSTERPTLLRAGAVTEDDLTAILGPIDKAGSDDKSPKSPGMLTRHYAPSAPLRMDAEAANDGEALLAFGPHHAATAHNLSQTGDLTEAAGNLYAMLREIDATHPMGIAVTPIPETGIGAAINDRLRRGCADHRDEPTNERGYERD